jgi:hypothetical protein
VILCGVVTVRNWTHRYYFALLVLLNEQRAARPTPYAPFVGITQSVRLCGDKGRLLLAVNNKVDFLYRQKHHGSESVSKEEIPLLDPTTNTFAGIKLEGGLDRKITYGRLQAKIEAVLAKVTFTVKYTKGEGWVESE